MRYLQLLCCSLFFVQVANAQDAVYTDTTADHSNKKIIRFKKDYKLEDPRLQKVAVIEVLPVQWDTARLGFVQKGITNSRAEAVPPLPFNQYLQQFVNQQYGGQMEASGLHILWAVKDVRINERSFAMNERGFCRLKADAYMSRDGGRQYALVQSFDTVVFRNGMDVTSRHDENIARAVHTLLVTTLNKGLDATAESLQSKEAVIAAQLAAQQPPIIQATEYKEGVYASFAEFKANNPSITGFKVEKVKKKLKIFRDDAAQTPITDVWGFCAKGEIYRTIEKDVIPIEKSGNGFVISNYLQSAKRRNQAIFWSGASGGAIGGAIAGAAARAYLVTTIPNIPNQQPEATAIDMETGELTL